MNRQAGPKAFEALETAFQRAAVASFAAGLCQGLPPEVGGPTHAWAAARWPSAAPSGSSDLGILGSSDLRI